MGTVYVSPSGSNGGSGSSGDPWKTLSYAASNSANGDTIKVRSGTYTETLKIAKTGQTWEPDSGQTPILDGGYTTGDQGNPPGGDLPGSEYASMVSVEGNNTKFTGFKIQNVAGEGMQVSGDNCEVGHCTLDWLYGGGIIIDSGGGMCLSPWIHHNVITRANIKKYDPTRGSNTTTPAGVQSTLVFQRCSSPLCEHNTVKWTHGEGIVFGRGTTGGIMRYNWSINTGHVALYINRSQYSQMYGNVAYHDGTGPYTSQRDNKPPEGIVYGDESGPKVRNFARSTAAEIYNNLVVGYQMGFQVRCVGANYGGSSLKDVYIAHNMFANCREYGIRIQNPTEAAHQGVIVENNVIYNRSGLGQVSFNVSSISGVSIRRNAWSAQPAAALRASGDIVGNLQLVNPNASFNAGDNDFAIENYYPTAQSPFLDRAQYGGSYQGYSPPIVVRDLENVIRDQTSPDMGPFQGTGAGTGGPGGDPGEEEPPPDPVDITGQRYVVATAVAKTSGSPTTQSISWPTELDVAPNAVIIFAVKATADDTPTDGLIMGMGFWGGSGQGSNSFNSLHGAADSLTFRDTSTAAALIILDDDSSTRDGEATISSVTETEVVLNWSNYPSAAYKMLIVGLVANESAVVSVTLPTSTNGTASLPLDFQPNLVFGICNQRSDAGWQGKAAFGIAYDNGSVLTQTGVAWESRKDQASALVNERMMTNAMLGYMHGSISWRISLGSLSSSGGVLTALDSGAAGVGIFLCLRMEDVGISLAALSTPTASGAQSTSLGFEPGFVFQVGTMLTAVDTDASDANAGTLAFGATDGTTSASVSISEQDNAAVMNNQSLASTALLEVPSDSGAAGYKAVFASFDETGFTETFTHNATARKRIILAMETTTAEEPPPEPEPEVDSIWIEEEEEMLPIGVAARITFTLISTSDGSTELTGAEPTVTISKNGAAYAAATNDAVEIGNGTYYIDLTATELNTVGPIAVRIIATGSRPVRRLFRVQSAGTAILSTAEWERGADIVLRRPLNLVEASSNGAAISFRSLYGALAKLVNKVAPDGGILSIYRTDDTTVVGQQALGTNEDASPIVSIDTI